MLSRTSALYSKCTLATQTQALPPASSEFGILLNLRLLPKQKHTYLFFCPLLAPL